MATNFENDKKNAVLICENNYNNMMESTNKKKLPDTFFNILIKIDIKVPTKSQSLFDISMIDTTCDCDCVWNNVETIYIDCYFAVQQHNIFYDVKAVQRLYFVCDNNDKVYKPGSYVVNDCDCDYFYRYDNDVVCGRVLQQVQTQSWIQLWSVQI